MSDRRERIESALAEQDASDRQDAWLLLGMGIPYTIGVMFFFSLVLALLLWWVAPLPLTGCWAITGSVVILASIVDVARHPSASWSILRYHTRGSLDIDAGYFHAGFAGMPLMADLSDPSTLEARGEQVVGGFTNAILAGPRNIRKGVELLKLMRARRASLDAAVVVDAWMAGMGRVAEREIEDWLTTKPELARGFLLLNEIGWFVRKRTGEGRFFEIR